MQGADLRQSDQGEINDNLIANAISSWRVMPKNDQIMCAKEYEDQIACIIHRVLQPRPN